MVVNTKIFLFLSILSVFACSYVNAMDNQEDEDKLRKNPPIQIVTELSFEKKKHADEQQMKLDQSEIWKQLSSALDDATQFQNTERLLSLCYMYFNELRGINAAFQANGSIARLIANKSFEDGLRDDLQKRLDRAAKSWNFEPDEDWWSLFSDSPKEVSEYWGENYGVNFTEIVHISHGGSVRFLTDFLQGKKLGYRLEKYGYGIQVSPETSKHTNPHMDRSREYATRIEGHTFDYPVVFEADIMAGQLLPANNKTEAGLPPASVSFLKNLKFTASKNISIPESVTNTLKALGEINLIQ